MIDLRSDTVTKPGPEMREYMLRAEVGDDVYGDDSTVLKLEEMAAFIMGKDAALFVPSGTMGNQIAIMTHCGRGDEVIADMRCHIVEHEAGGAAALSGVQLFMLDSKYGRMETRQVEAAIRDPNDIHFPETKLICLENAHGYGMVTPVSYMREIKEVGLRYGVPVHLDGARIFNAALCLKTDARELADCCDSLMFCLSKGLGAPVGSMLCGGRGFIDRARRMRKRLGGGMRQAGILAAAGIYALENNVSRLAEDHANARLLAAALSEIPGVEVDTNALDINMVWFRVSGGQETCRSLHSHMRERGIDSNPGDAADRVRLVTHIDATKADIQKAAKVISEYFT